MIIAIDGPAGSGKSTIAKLIAEDLGLVYLDTGAMYRLVTLKALNDGILGNLDKIIKMLDDLRIDIKKNGFYLIKKEFYKGTVVDRWETYSYNEKGLKTQEINYLKDGKIDFYEDKTYKYDEKGNPIEEKAVDKEGEVLYLYKINYTYYK